MNHILIIGAGRSAGSLIQYLLENASENNWKITIAEKDIHLAKEKVGSHNEVEVVSFDIMNEQQVHEEISKADLVVSMLPARFHITAAKKCAELGKDFLTASYLSEDIKALDDEFKAKGKHCLMELGLDPGIDHMSAMKVLDRIKAEGGELFCHLRRRSYVKGHKTYKPEL